MNITEQCKICYECYNTTDRKPMIMMMCCHTLCNTCLIDLKKTMSSYNCPTCRELIISEKPK